MTVLANIPAELNFLPLRQRARVTAGSEDEAEFSALVENVRRVVRPTAIYREAFVDSKGADTVTIEGIRFTSRTLRMDLNKAERVFAFVATCGRELDEIPLEPGDFLRQFWLDVLKSALLASANQHLQDHLGRQFGLGKTATMSPGSGDATVWPIEQQRELFALLGDVERSISGELTDIYLMIPNKTVSGVRFSTEVDFRTCQLCHREVCSSRSVPFDPALWTAMQHE